MTILRNRARVQTIALDRPGAHLRTAGGLNGSTLLSSVTVRSDGSVIDTPFGEGGLDWFWDFGHDVIGDLNQGGVETVN